MNETIDLIQILTEIAPLALTTIVLGLILLALLWVAAKVLVPSLRAMIDISKAMQESWRQIVEEQRRINEAIKTEMLRDLTDERVERKKLAERVAHLEGEIARRDTRIAELEKELGKLRLGVKERDDIIVNLRGELDRVIADRKKVEKERDELNHRLAALEGKLSEVEKKQAQEGKPDGKDTPAS